LNTRQVHDRIIGHDDLSAYAAAKVNLIKATVDDRRAQLDYLTLRLEHYIGEHPDYDLIKIRGSGSVTKGTAIKGSSDADMAAYVRASAVGGVSAPASHLLDWLRGRLIEVYGDTKRPEDFQASDHAVAIVFHGSGLKVDVAPVIYEGDPDDRGHLVTRDGKRVLTSIRLHIKFIRERKRDHGPAYAQLIRLLKAWVREQKRLDGSFRCKSFLVELLVAHLADHGWGNQPLALDDYPTALEQAFAYIASTRLAERVAFDDYYPASELPGPTGKPMEVFDPVNPANNIVGGYSSAERDRLVAAAHEALDAIAEAEYADTKGRAIACWKRVFGPGFGA
jgi:tRNA nucleotidyltransferase (CCA-adding enzyme)